MKTDVRLPDYLEKSFQFPEFFRIRRRFDENKLEDLEETLEKSLRSKLDQLNLKRGSSVCVGVGSRGIKDIVRICRTTISTLKKAGLNPFIIPAMGSHGGATNEGQRKILEILGISEISCGCPIVSELSVKKIGSVFGEVPVFFASDALSAHYSICINRIKPHTKFKAAIESGVFKMLTVGMGKHQGALAYHKWALKYGFFNLLREMGSLISDRSNFQFGIGIVENAYDETANIDVISKDEILSREAELLKRAKAYLPRLPSKCADVLIISQVGKDISGSGMDPNITGRAVDFKEDDFSDAFAATRLAILNLSEGAKGNALGIGNADFITRKVFDSIDYEATLMNILTSVSIKKAAIPVIMPTDEKVIQACFTTVGPIEPNDIRAIIIKDTLHVSDCWVSEALYGDLSQGDRIELVERRKINFDESGNLNLFESE